MTTQNPAPRHYLREWRIKRNLKQEELAKLVGTLKSVISRYELGERGVSLEMQWRLFEALDITPTQFFLGPDEVDLNVIAKGQPLEVRRILAVMLEDAVRRAGDRSGT